MLHFQMGTLTTGLLAWADIGPSKAIHNRLAHITHMDRYNRDFFTGFPTFCYIFIAIILRNPSNSSTIRCSSVAKPWPYIPKVQGSNPTEAKEIFHSFQIKRLHDSIDDYCKIALGIQSKRLKLQNQIN